MLLRLSHRWSSSCHKPLPDKLQRKAIEQKFRQFLNRVGKEDPSYKELSGRLNDEVEEQNTKTNVVNFDVRFSTTRPILRCTMTWSTEPIKRREKES
jgi:hypothetical protein